MFCFEDVVDVGSDLVDNVRALDVAEGVAEVSGSVAVRDEEDAVPVATWGSGLEKNEKGAASL